MSNTYNPDEMVKVKHLNEFTAQLVDKIENSIYLKLLDGIIGSTPSTVDGAIWLEDDDT